MKFLLIEDNYDLASAICARVRSDGHVIDHADRISDAIEFSQVGEYDLILLDLMLPDGSGLDLCREVKSDSTTQDIPIIILTAKDDEVDKVVGFELGADDYVTKPFDHAELEARCRAVLRRNLGTAQPVTRLGNVAFNAVAGSLTIGMWLLILGTKNCACLNCLLMHQAKFFQNRNLLTDYFLMMTMYLRMP